MIYRIAGNFRWVLFWLLSLRRAPKRKISPRKSTTMMTCSGHHENTLSRADNENLTQQKISRYTVITNTTVMNIIKSCMLYKLRLFVLPLTHADKLRQTLCSLPLTHTTWSRSSPYSWGKGCGFITVLLCMHSWTHFINHFFYAPFKILFARIQPFTGAIDTLRTYYKTRVLIFFLMP